jgi:hypothetical protein
MKNILILSCLFIVFSCSNNPTEPEKVETINLKLRTNFMSNKSFEEIKYSYNRLNAKEKLTLWDEKLDQILNEGVSDDIKPLIINLKSELNKSYVNLEDIREIGLELANTMPQEQFENMFIKLDDYKKQDFQKIGVSDDIKYQLKNNPMEIDDFIATADTNINNKYLIDCSCDWTCSTFCNYVTTKCNQTSSGCGFLWAFECGYACGL